MTLLSQVQALLERTYASIGLNLEQCVVGPDRCAVLTVAAGESAHDLAPGGRTFLRLFEDRLYLAIFYADPVILELEKYDPRRVLNERNISPLIVFVEEIAHGIQAGLLFLEGERSFAGEAFARNMEAQAKIDTYLVLCKFAHLLCGDPVPEDVRDWVRAQVFDDSHRRFASAHLRARYQAAQALAETFIAHLSTLPVNERQPVLRTFRRLAWHQKRTWLADL